MKPVVKKNVTTGSTTVVKFLFHDSDHARWLGKGTKIASSGFRRQYFYFFVIIFTSSYQQKTNKMGNGLSSPPLLPLTFADCFTEGSINIQKYQLYLLIKRQREDSLHAPINLIPRTQSNVDDGHQKKKRKRYVKKHRV